MAPEQGEGPMAAWLSEQEGVTTLRFLTCGSVDDGKSTLIGRLLYDAKMVFEDQLAALERDSRRHGTADGGIDFALLVDGLEAEREQGITIDVAYRFFATPKRRFIVADTPGHEQFTRNMATGASTAELAVMLVDARKGVLPQTRRHTIIASLLGVPRLVLAVNKMDMVDWGEETFGKIAAEYGDFCARLGFAEVTAIPLSARHGDNVTTRSERAAWYPGPTLLAHLEDVPSAQSNPDAPMRLPIQYVSRPDQDFRGLAGTLASGTLVAGQEVMLARSGARARVARILRGDAEVGDAIAGEAVTVVLDRDVEGARGDMLAPPDAQPHCVDQFSANLVWFDEHVLLPGRSYLLRTETDQVPATVTSLKHRISVDTLAGEAARSLAMNEIGVVNISTQAPVVFDAYADNRATGAFVLIDRVTNATVGAGMILHPLRRATNIRWQGITVDRSARAALMGQRPKVLWFTGLSGSGKSTIADLLDRRLFEAGRHATILDGDNVRHGLNRDLGFTEEDRVENIRRVAEVARLMADAGLIVLVSFISPFAAERRMARDLIGPDEFVEIFVDTPFEECARRDPKGLYARAARGEIKNFTGLDSPYEAPEGPEIHLRTIGATPEELVDAIEAWLSGRP